MSICDICDIPIPSRKRPGATPAHYTLAGNSNVTQRQSAKNEEVSLGSEFLSPESYATGPSQLMAPDRYDRGSSRRGVWSHWVPLAITVTVATAGLAAWVWSQRKDGDEDHGDYDHEPHEPGLDYENADYGDNPPYGSTSRDQRPDRPARQADGGYSTQHDAQLDSSAPTWGARMSGALRRTPSPQQFLDSTGKTVAAGVAAAGAAMGKALASIREEDKQYGENPWSEEADAKRERAPIVYDKKRKTVAVVVSADAKISDHAEDDGTHELAVRPFIASGP